ncbi:MAG: hypothetical protein ABI821_11930 [Pseudomonadota bacterium]
MPRRPLASARTARGGMIRGRFESRQKIPGRAVARLPLAPGHQARQLRPYLYAACITIGLLAFVSFFQT